jgi:hypothetical protein
MPAKQRFLTLGLLCMAASTIQAEVIKGTMSVTGGEMH